MAEAANEARRELWSRGTPRFSHQRNAASNTVQYQFAKMLSFATNRLLIRIRSARRFWIKRMGFGIFKN